MYYGNLLTKFDESAICANTWVRNCYFFIHKTHNNAWVFFNKK